MGSGFGNDVHLAHDFVVVKIIAPFPLGIPIRHAPEADALNNKRLALLRRRTFTNHGFSIITHGSHYYSRPGPVANRILLNKRQYLASLGSDKGGLTHLNSREIAKPTFLSTPEYFELKYQFPHLNSCKWGN